MMSLFAKARAVSGQSRFRVKERLWKRWRNGLDAERLVWWEVGKHAEAMGRRCNSRYYWCKLVEGIERMKKKRIEDNMVRTKMIEVQSWLK